MIKDSEIVTRSYLDRKLDVFDEKFDKKLSNQKIEIIREVRIMMHETMEQGMKNMRLSYEAQGQRHMDALHEGFRDQIRVFTDGMKMTNEKLDNHEQRIIKFEMV